jgi:hypothetical protein
MLRNWQRILGVPAQSWKYLSNAEVVQEPPLKNLIVSLAFVLSAAAASAQCNTNHLTVSDELHNSGETIVGTVQGAQNAPDSSFHLDGVNYVVKVDRILHGKMIGTDTVTIFSENSPEKFPMQVGKQYLLFVHLDYNRYTIDNCGNSGLLEASTIENAHQLKQLAKNK